MGTLTMVKLGVSVVVLLALSYFVLNYRHMQAKIALQATVIEQQQQSIEYYQKAAKIDVDTAKQKEDFHEVLQSGDHQRIVDYFKRMRALSAGGKGGGS